MNYSVMLHGKSIDIKFSKRAHEVFSKRSGPLYVDMQLLFSCMVAKKVMFSDQLDGDVASASDLLKLSFRAVGYDSCSVEGTANTDKPVDFPLKRDISKFTPNHLSIDYLKGEYTGEFSFKAQ